MVKMGQNRAIRAKCTLVLIKLRNCLPTFEATFNLKDGLKYIILRFRLLFYPTFQTIFIAQNS